MFGDSLIRVEFGEKAKKKSLSEGNFDGGAWILEYLIFSCFFILKHPRMI